MQALCKIKNQIIGNRIKKLLYLRLGAVAAVVASLAEPGASPAALVQAEAAARTTARGPCWPLASWVCGLKKSLFCRFVLNCEKICCVQTREELTETSSNTNCFLPCFLVEIWGYVSSYACNLNQKLLQTAA